MVDGHNSYPVEPRNNGDTIDLRFFRASNEPFRQIIDYDWKYESGERRLAGATIDDPLYGRFEFDTAAPGDAALLELFLSEPFNRLDLIEQLTLPREYATKPETAGYTVYEHSMGCALLTRKLGGSAVQQIRAAIHDLSKRAFGHLDDWRQEGIGGPETHHETLLRRHLEYWELDTMLESHGFSVDELVDPQPPDFVENKAPAVCVDRADYALREFARWTCPEAVPKLIEDLGVVEDKIVFSNQESASVFGRNYNRLYWEHWAETKHTVREKLLLIMIEYGIEHDVIQEDDMDMVDVHVLAKLELGRDEVIDTLFSLLQGPSQRIVIDQGFESALPKEVLQGQRDRLFVPIRDFRRRSVDPNFIDEQGEVVKVSDVDAEFREYLELVSSLKTSSDWEEFARDHGIDEAYCTYAELEVDEYTKATLSGIHQLL